MDLWNLDQDQFVFCRTGGHGNPSPGTCLFVLKMYLDTLQSLKVVEQTFPPAFTAKYQIATVKIQPNESGCTQSQHAKNQLTTTATQKLGVSSLLKLTLMLGNVSSPPWNSKQHSPTFSFKSDTRSLTASHGAGNEMTVRLQYCSCTAYLEVAPVSSREPKQLMPLKRAHSFPARPLQECVYKCAENYSVLNKL